MKSILLTKGQKAKVDDEDYEDLARHKWYASWSVNVKGFYAYRRVYASDGTSQVVSMHRAIMKLAKGDKMQVDHINHDTLDNRRRNLRIVTLRQNLRNSRMMVSNTSGYRGVSWHKGAKKWIAMISTDRGYKYLGLFAKVEEAHEAYCAAAKERDK